MDRWISAAWKAFWVGLGASAVLVSQAVFAPAAPAAAPVPAPPPAVVVPRAAAASPAAENAQSSGAHRDVLSRYSPRCATRSCS